MLERQLELEGGLTVCRLGALRPRYDTVFTIPAGQRGKLLAIPAIDFAIRPVYHNRWVPIPICFGLPARGTPGRGDHLRKEVMRKWQLSI